MNTCLGDALSDRALGMPRTLGGCSSKGWVRKPYEHEFPLSNSRLPIPFVRDRTLRDWESLYSCIADATAGQDNFARTDLVRELNDFTFASLRLDRRARAGVNDFVRIRSALTRGKIGVDAIRHPSVEELESYAGTLRDDLDAFVGEKTLIRQCVDALSGGGSGLLVVEIVGGTTGRLPVWPLTATDEAARSFAAARRQLVEQHGQWLYFSRNFRVYKRPERTS
jgi:hypothetical protein